MTGATIELAEIGKTFPGIVALHGVAVSLGPGRVHALVGENGAGKSTLIHILGGSLQPDQGTIHLDGSPIHFPDTHTARRLGIVTVHQEVELFPDLTVAENIALEQGLPGQRLGWISQGDQLRRARLALAQMGSSIDPQTLAAVLSPAQRQLVLLGAALTQPARVLILDEPTSSLSGAEATVLFEQIRQARKRGLAILYVSHRFEEIFALADEVTVLRDGRRVWHGSIADTTPAQLIGAMVGRDIPLTHRPPPASAGPVRLQCSKLTAADSSFTDVSLEVRGGEVLGLYGLVGAGRSEWAQGLLGFRPLASGQVWINGQIIHPAGPGPMAQRGLAYVPEDRLRQGLCRDLSVCANLVLASLHQLARGLWLAHSKEARRTRAAVDHLAIRVRSIEQAIGTLSGGNQQKVVVTRWLERQPTVLILDEPTRGIDVAAKDEIHALIRRLAGEGRAIVLISSDLPEVLGQSDRVGVFRQGRLADVFDARKVSAAAIAEAALPVQGRAGDHGDEPVLPPTAKHAESDWRRALPLREAGLALLIVLLFAVLQAGTGRFLQPGNLWNLATDTALLSVCSLAVLLVLLVGGIDISLGSVMAFSAAVAGSLWQRGQPLALVLGVAVLVGGLAGAGNAALTLIGRVHPIVITLGSLSVYRGLTQWWLEQDVNIPNSAREGLVSPWPGLAVAAGLALVLHRSVVGRQIYAMGSNPDAARRAGISRWLIWLIVFAGQGMLAGLAGLLHLARSGQLQTVSYEDKTLEAIGAAVVGGVAITGGRGSVLGVLLGCLFLVSLGPACLFLHLPTTWQRSLVGLVIVVAVLLDSRWRRRQS